jgi:hypothetical protein
LERLPDSIRGLGALQKLALHGNRLSALPLDLSGLACLRELWLQGNDLEELSSGICELTVRFSLGLWCYRTYGQSRERFGKDLGWRHEIESRRGRLGNTKGF